MTTNCRQLERIMEVADRYGIPVVEDAAEGFGSRFDGRVLGTFGRFGVLSFNGNKMITTSGGGALICQNAEDKQTELWVSRFKFQGDRFKIQDSRFKQ